jgi:adenylate cyclase, class 2
MEKIPYVEVEVKLRYAASAGAAQSMIESHGYSLVEPRALESDRVFDRQDGELRRSDQLLRLRKTGARAMITYKGPSRRERHKSREEIEFDVSDAAALTEVLERLGYAPRFHYEKYRAKFAGPGEPGFITIDETPIGVFLELEGPPVWIDATAERLGFSPSEYLTSSYSSLYGEYRRSNPDAPVDMTFLDERDRRTIGKES